jgi:MYXO-CTERM domain-containing protein
MVTPVRAFIRSVTGALLLGGCDEVYTEHRQVELRADVHADSLRSGDDIVQGSTVCLQYAGYRVSADEPPAFAEASDERLRACYDERIEGPAMLVDRCIALPDAGDVTWIAERRPCAIEGSFTDDALRLSVLPFADVRGAFDYAVPWSDDWFALELEFDPPLAAFPAGYFATVGAPVRVVEGTIDTLTTRVVHIDAPRRIASTGGRAQGMALRGDPSFVDDPEDPSPTLHFTARAGDDFHVTLSLPAGELDVGDVHVVARSEIATVTWAPLVARVRGTDEFLQLGAMVVAYDGDGNVLREPGANWEVVDGRGTLETFDFDDNGEPDPSAWANLVDACDDAAAGERREATLRGRLDGFEGTVVVRWQCVEQHGTDGCGCRHDGEPSAWPLVVVLALGRRRSATRARVAPRRHAVERAR